MRAKFCLLFALLTTPAFAAATDEGRTQETVAVSEGRFLIFVGAPSEKQMGYTADLIKVENGIPTYLPLFIEEYDHDTNTTKLSYGVAFEAKSYHYNKAKHSLDINSLEPESEVQLNYHYTLDNDILHLQTVTTQDKNCKKPCKPTSLYKRKS